MLKRGFEAELKINLKNPKIFYTFDTNLKENFQSYVISKNTWGKFCPVYYLYGKIGKFGYIEICDRFKFLYK